MLGSKQLKISQSEARVCVRAYLSKNVTDLYSDCAAGECEYPSNFLTVNQVYRDYIGTGGTVSVSYSQFVKALRTLKPDRCYVNKYNNHILIGHTLGAAAEHTDTEEITTIV